MLDIRPETTYLIMLALLPLVRAAVPALPAPNIAGLLTARCASQAILVKKELTPFQRSVEQAKKILARTCWDGYDPRHLKRIKDTAAAIVASEFEVEREAARTDKMIRDTAITAFEKHQKTFVPRPLFHGNDPTNHIPLKRRHSAIAPENRLLGGIAQIAPKQRVAPKYSRMPLITISEEKVTDHA